MRIKGETILVSYSSLAKNLVDKASRGNDKVFSDVTPVRME